MIEGSYDLNGRADAQLQPGRHRHRQRKRDPGYPGRSTSMQLTVTSFANQADQADGPDVRGDHPGASPSPRSSDPGICCGRLERSDRYDYGGPHERLDRRTNFPRYAGRTVIVTGANSGLGEVTARELARVGAKVIVAVRNLDKGNAAAAGMTRRRRGAQARSAGPGVGPRAFADSVDTVDLLINNAGIMAVPYAQTVDGFESQIGTNHLGHFALTNLLLPKDHRSGGDGVVDDAPAREDQPQGPELDVAALFRMAGLRAVEAGQSAVHQRSCSAGSTQRARR